MREKQIFSPFFTEEVQLTCLSGIVAVFDGNAVKPGLLCLWISIAYTVDLIRNITTNSYSLVSLMGALVSNCYVWLMQGYMHCLEPSMAQLNWQRNLCSLGSLTDP